MYFKAHKLINNLDFFRNQTRTLKSRLVRRRIGRAQAQEELNPTPPALVTQACVLRSSELLLLLVSIEEVRKSSMR
jgi:hypothetical protein